MPIYYIYSMNHDVQIGTAQLVTYVKGHDQANRKVDELSTLNPDTYYYHVGPK